MTAVKSAPRKTSKAPAKATKAKVTKAAKTTKVTKAAKAPAAKATKAAKAPAAKATKAAKAPAAKAPAAKTTKTTKAAKAPAAKATKAAKAPAAKAPAAKATARVARSTASGSAGHTALAKRPGPRADSGWEGRSAAGTRHTRIDQAVGQYRHLLETVDQALRSQLIDAVTARASTASTGAKLDASLWGEEPSEAAVSATELDQLRIQFERRRALTERSVSRDDAAELLRISSQAVTDHLRHGDLTGIKESNRWLIPLWQFDADCERGFLPGISALVDAFPGGVVSLSRWVTAPNPNFADRSPREVMAAGDADSVAAAAAALTAAGW